MPKEKSLGIIIPALARSSAIPGYLLKKLDGTTLIQRAINRACIVVPPKSILVITDACEVELIAERNGVSCERIPASDVELGPRELYTMSKTSLRDSEKILILSPKCPLLDKEEILTGLRSMDAENYDVLLSVSRIHGRSIATTAIHENWDQVLANGTEKLYVHLSQAFMAFSTHALTQSAIKVGYHHLPEEVLEIDSAFDWWVSEKLLRRKRIVFVVAGYGAIGMGHVYRALMFAHEIHDHDVIFLCTSESEIGAAKIAQNDYRVEMQDGTLLDSVLELKPDLVINDILNTDEKYMTGLLEKNICAVNFEDLGSGANYANIVFNALLEGDDQCDNDKYCYGSKYYCLRDEFIESKQRCFGPFKELLLTFGGTDSNNFTYQTLRCLASMCREYDIHINIVSGPGYLHKDMLINYLADFDESLVSYTHATNVMSSIMEKCDFAICSNGRTVYELAHMRIPAIVLSHHEREATHSFAQESNGFLHLGVMNPFDEELLQSTFQSVLEGNKRQLLFDRLSLHDFSKNKRHVVKRLLSLLEKG